MAYNPNTIGQTTMANSSPVVIASDQSAVTTVLQPQAAFTYNQAGVIAINTDLITIDCSTISAISLQCTSMGTLGSINIYFSNDNVNFTAVNFISSVSAAQVSVINNIGLFSIQALGRYCKLRMGVATTGGTTTLAIQGFYNPQNLPLINQPVTITSGNITAANLAVPGLVIDGPSGALTVTTTTGTIAPTSGNSYTIDIAITAVSGTSPTFDFQVQESADAGVNWYAVYDFPRITATGSYNSPFIPFTGNRVRYVQTVGGTTPSFTRAINRLQMNIDSNPLRQMFDRTVNLTTMGSTTASLNAFQLTKNIMMTINIGAATTAPALQIQGTDDFGASWYNVGTPLTSVASSTVSVTVASITAQLFRAIVTTPGVGVTAGYVMLRAF